tara:strand:- start:1086 stop:1268 length:183 start_codon:yes stop_codon:yes gene_type:complete
MKKLIAIIFILLIGLFVVSGCASTSEPETKTQGTGAQEPDQQTQKEQAGGGIPQPPALPE